MFHGAVVRRPRVSDRQTRRQEKHPWLASAKAYYHYDLKISLIAFKKRFFNTRNSCFVSKIALAQVLHRPEAWHDVMKSEDSFLTLSIRIILCLLTAFRPNLSLATTTVKENKMLSTDQASFTYPGHTFQVIMNDSDVCTLQHNDSIQEQISLLDYFNRNFATIESYGHNRLRKMIDKIIRERIREYRQRKKARHRVRHKQRTRQQKQRQRHLDLEQSSSSDTESDDVGRDKRSTEGRKRDNGCLPVSTFGIDQDELLNTDGSVTKIECCYSRGRFHHDGFLDLCAACFATTTLTPDFFPRDIHEQICLGELLTSAHTYSGCLLHAGVWHGRCTQKTVHQNFLRRRKKDCDLRVTADDHLKVEEWTQETIPVRTGCECRMNQLSLLTALVDKGL